ncbi:D-alanine-D-alanine ligase [Talaromyces islandicus]|uniref:D-alanine-D-alanine ligase n=1 Tax=Talaromyces islandicus TaxID=28573 RepID=A0A0U1LW10_TALIS|nr:D-alanine-D-alanine ligase [Talaromyces islandicus]
MPHSDMPSISIALVAERRSDYLNDGYSEDECAAFPHNGEIEQVLAALQSLNHRVTLVLGIHSLAQQLAASKHRDWDLVFNMSQGFCGKSREFQVPALLEAYQIPFTFADAATMALCQDKTHTKVMLKHLNIPTAPFYVVAADSLDASYPNLPTGLTSYPLFAKLATEGSSKGIGNFNKINNPTELDEALRELKTRYPGQPIILEPFLSGREFTVSILGTGQDSRVIGIREHIWGRHLKDCDSNETDCHCILDFATKESKSNNASDNGARLSACDYEMATVEDSQINAACKVALDAWKSLLCRDAGRVDIRFDNDDPNSVPNILEVTLCHLPFVPPAIQLTT